MQNSSLRPNLIPAVHYKDPVAAIEWLEHAFGFERCMLIYDKGGRLVHSELKFGSGRIMVGAEWADYTASPASAGGKNTQSIHIQLEHGLDEHCAHARAAGAAVLREPEDQFYGDRVYSARDPEGHVWSFGQTLRQVSREEAEQASGLRIEGWV
ncbi:VOC family protein [Candidimonas nitroreducens]|uniref:Glyoxalase n=1 Tax=Candidimonas nitroreducens TaxID=683354 RepID=A0A225MWN4_9BURK|nr:VOC family protein [Candidimonas nitroreducens]OWT65635.1 glyoxalase [Candidimonas nitroreducens]